MSALSLSVLDQALNWHESHVLPFIQESADRVAQSFVQGFSSLSSLVSGFLYSGDQSSHLVRVASSVSTFVGSWLGKIESKKETSSQPSFDLFKIVTCFSFPNYILGGSFAEDWKEKQIWTICSSCFRSLATLSATAIIFFPTLATKQIIVLHGQKSTLGEVGILSSTLAACCDLAKKIHRFCLNRSMAAGEFFDMMSSTSDVFSSFLLLFRVQTKVALLSLSAFSHLSALFARALTKNT